MASVRSWRQVGNLPVEIKSFVGRRRKLQEARRLLDDTRLLTLVGVGGVGKTQLALRLAAGVRRTFPDGVWWVELAPLQDEELVPQTVIAALGLRDQSDRPPTDILCDFLADKRLLLVLDNCEHLPDACAILASKLLGGAEGLRILATSRQVLGVEGEQLFEVPPLTVPDLDHLSGTGSSLIEYEAVRLFVERAAAVVPDFAITAGNGAAVARLCWRLDGIPLAIELAAVRLRVLSVEQILERLDDRFRLLTGGARVALPRHQTLRAAIDWSFELCSPQEQILWARLSVFSGGFDLEAAEQTCSDEQIAREEICYLVAGLVDRSILAREQHGSQMRYRLLETIRQYGRQRLSDSDEEIRLRYRHCDYYYRLVARAQAESSTPGQAEWLQRLLPDLPNVRVALDFCLTTPGQTQTGLHIGAALYLYWVLYGLLNEARQWLTRALALDPQPTLIRVKALTVAASIIVLLGDLTTALALRDECLALARKLDDPRALAHAAYTRGLVAWAQGDLHQAVSLLTEALERARADGDDPYEMFHDLMFRAMASALQGDDRSEAHSAQALQAARDAGAQFMIAWATWTRGLHHCQQGQTRQATSLFKESLRWHRTFGNVWGYAWCTEALAWTAAIEGQHERAARLFGATQASLRSLGGLGGFHLFAAAHQRYQDLLREGLGQDAYTVALQAGNDLGLEEALNYATADQTPPPRRPDTIAPDATSVLTRRERQVAELIADGMSNKQIAARLVIAQRTADSHVEHILTKLGFTSRTQIAAWLAAPEKGEGAVSS